MSHIKAPKVAHYERAAAIFPDPRTIHDPDPDTRESILDAYKGPIIGTYVGGGAQVFRNWFYSRPLYAGIHLTIIGLIAGGIAGHYIRETSKKYFTFRDQVYRHYIQLHPEEFPAPEKKLIGEKWIMWIPCR